MDPRPVDFSYRRPRHENLTYQSYGLSQSIYHVGAYAKKFSLPPSNVPNISAQKSLKANPQQLIHNNSSRWNIKEQKLNKSYIYQNPSTFTNVHTRMPRQNLSKSMLMNASGVSNKNQSLIMTTNQSQMKIPYYHNRSASYNNIQNSKPLLENRSYPLEDLSRKNIRNQADSLSNWTYSLMKPNKAGQLQDRVYQYQQKPYNILNFQHKAEPDQHRQYPRFSLQHKIKQRSDNIFRNANKNESFLKQ